jgi:hypothetical protein
MDWYLMFSKHNPKLQTTWDSTSLGALQFCPRFYQYNILEGYRTESIDLDFGIFVHMGKEVYNKALLAGASWQEAQIKAVKAVFEATLPKVPDGDPWSGVFADMWRCTGATKYKNKKGNAAKCPFSHVGKWFDAPGPQVCGECGSPTEHVNRFLPFHKIKHRTNLLRLIAWYAEDVKDGPWKPAFVPGTDKPAVEMHFVLPLMYPTTLEPRLEPLQATNQYGDGIFLSGYLDTVKEYHGDFYWTDTKTTAKSMGQMWGEQFDSNLQMSFYGWAAPQIFPTSDLKGGLIEGSQVTKYGVAFGEHFIPDSTQLRSEFIYDTLYWLGEAEKFAERDYWPKNRRNCFLCPFKKVCSADPEDREYILKGNFQVKFWDPTKERV